MAYAYYRTCTTDHTQAGSSDSTNFPVLVSFTDTTMKLVANGGHINNTVTSNGQTVCADLAFYSDSGLTTLLNFEVEFYDGVNGILIAWVQLPTLSHTANVVFYMVYDSASVTTFQGNVNGTWDSYCEGVWHFSNGTTLSLNDSTVNANTGTIVSTVTAASGMIGGGAGFPVGADGYVQIGTGPDIQAPLTLSAWLNPQSSGVHRAILGGDSVNIEWRVDAGLTLSFLSEYVFVMGSSTGTIALNVWAHSAVTYDGNNLAFYIDGSPSGSSTVGSVTFRPSADFAIAGAHTPNEYFGGSLDEVRIAQVIRSADWILSEYNNQKASSTFLTVGSETPIGGGSSPKRLAALGVG